MSDNLNNNFGHNSKGIIVPSEEKIDRRRKRGFNVEIEKSGLRIDYYNTRLARRIVRKILIKLNLFQKLKNLKKKLIVKFKLKKKVDDVIKNLTKDKLPLFDTISIETFSKCNGGCSFCPVNRFDDPRPDILMDEKLFKKILVDLYNLDYDNQLILSLNNEPFLDKRIYSFAEMARKYLPKAFIAIWTNGTPLNVDRFKKIINNINELVIDNYNDNLVWHPNIKKIMRYENDILETRAGQAKNRTYIKPLKVSCVYPFTTMNIQVDGNVSLCCNDALAKEIVGNVKKKSLEDVWFSEEYNGYRKKINISRELISICEGCDTVDIPKAS
jgi:radical SAM protein with 4Fe4S-binding SPASM domain